MTNHGLEKTIRAMTKKIMTDKKETRRDNCVPLEPKYCALDFLGLWAARGPQPQKKQYEAALQESHQPKKLSQNP